MHKVVIDCESVLIDTINKGDYVLSFNTETKLNEYKEVLDSYENTIEPKDQIKINYNDSNYIITSKWHPLLVNRGNYEFIRSDETLLFDKGRGIEGDVSIIHIDKDPNISNMFWDLEVEGTNNYYCSTDNKDNNYYVVHNTRPGSFAPYLDVWHPDIRDFLDMKRKGGDERKRAHDLFPAICIPDLFMKVVHEGYEINGEKDTWYLMSTYHTGEDLINTYGSEWEAKYLEYVNNPNIPKQKIKASELWKYALNTYYKDGNPFLFWRDNHNKSHALKDMGTIKSSQLCFTGDTIVATADGRNGVTIKQLALESNGKVKFPVYSARLGEEEATWGIDNTTNRKKLLKFKKNYKEIKNAVAFKTGTNKVITIKLENGDTFRCTPDHELMTTENGEYVKAKDSLNRDLEGFFTYARKGPGCSYRYINTKNDFSSQQHKLIYRFYNPDTTDESYNNGMNIDHISDDNKGYLGDNINNLIMMDKEDHRRKTYSNFIHNNPMTRKSTDEDEKIKSSNKSKEVSAHRNPNGSPLTNYEVIVLCKYAKRLHGEFNHDVYDSLWYEYGLPMPVVLNNSRFGEGGFDTLCKYVNEELEYLPEWDNIEYDDRIDFNSSRIEYLNTWMCRPYDDQPKHAGKTKRKYAGLKVIEIIDNNEVEDVYDLTVEDNHNFYIITSTEDDQYKNCQGVLVHNCTELSQITWPDITGIKITFKESFDYEAIKKYLVSELLLTEYRIDSHDNSITIPEDISVLTDFGVVRAKKLSALHTLITDSGNYKLFRVDRGIIELGQTAVCNLLSLNTNMKEDRRERVSKLAIMMLDNVIDLNFYPTLKSQISANRFRAIAIGKMNVFNYVVNTKRCKWDSREARNEIAKMMSDFTKYELEASYQLGLERGSFDYFEQSEWKKGILPYDHYKDTVYTLIDKDVANECYAKLEPLRKLVSKALRNGYLQAPAPTGSISIISDCTSSVEGIYKRYWYEENSSGLIPVVAPGINAENWNDYNSVYDYDPMLMAANTAVVQGFTDQSISYNTYVHKNGNYKIDGNTVDLMTKLSMTFYVCWKLGFKSNYYLRSKSPEVKEEVPDAINRVGECVNCQ